MRFSPRAATRLGVKPNSEMRAAIAASATPSTTSALSTSSSCRPSKKSGGACGSRADAAYRTSPTTTASSRSKPISTSRFTLMGLPVHTIVARNTSSRSVNSGVNSLVSTGAMFSMTLCFASTERDEHEVDGQLAREPYEVHAPTVGEPAASDVREADGQPEGDWQVQRGQYLRVAARAEGVDI